MLLNHYTFKRQLKTYLFCKILMTKCTQHTGDFFEYALHIFTLYLLTYFMITKSPAEMHYLQKVKCKLSLSCKHKSVTLQYKCLTT